MSGRIGKKGFTLLEVLMALGIFAIIGIATVKQINQIQATKDIAFQDIEFYGGLRAAISMMRYDISQAFHIPYEELGSEIRTAVMQGEKAPHTLFDGRKKELIFTSLSHRNFYAGRRECDQTEISYFLQPTKGANTSTLMKRESALLDSDLYAGGNIYSLVDGVQTLEFSYWDHTQGKWVDEWNSDAGNYRDQFPMGVRVKISVLDKDGKPLTAETTMKLAFTNNDPVFANLR